MCLGTQLPLFKQILCWWNGKLPIDAFGSLGFHFCSAKLGVMLLYKLRVVQGT